MAGGLKSHPSTQVGHGDYSSTSKLVNSITGLTDDQDIDVLSAESVPANGYWAHLSTQKKPFLENPLRGRNSKHKTKIHVIGILASKRGTP